MISGDPHLFIETVYSGQEIDFRFRGKHYFYQGYKDSRTGLCHMEVVKRFPPYDSLWEYDAPSNLKCGEAFQKTPMFDGKTFWEAEEEIEWFDE